jgi:DNA-directed RNA polymerase specialized sigma24 family protein
MAEKRYREMSDEEAAEELRNRLLAVKQLLAEIRDALKEVTGGE